MKSASAARDSGIPTRGPIITARASRRWGSMSTRTTRGRRDDHRLTAPLSSTRTDTCRRRRRRRSNPAASSLRDLIIGKYLQAWGMILYVQQTRGRRATMGGVRLPRRQLPDVAVSRASGQAEPAGVLECSWSGGGSMYIISISPSRARAAAAAGPAPSGPSASPRASYRSPSATPCATTRRSAATRPSPWSP